MLQEFSFMSPLVLFGKQLLITASCPGTKTHFRSSHSKLNEHHIPHLPPAQHPPSTTFQPRQRSDTVWPDNKNPSLRVSSPACRMFNHPPPTLQHLTANTDNSQNHDAETAFETFSYNTGSHKPPGTLTLSPDELPFTFPRQLLRRSG